MRAVGFGFKEHFEQAWGAQVENRVAVAGGEVTQGAEQNGWDYSVKMSRRLSRWK
jgi:hypothetical protein